MAQHINRQTPELAMLLLATVAVRGGSEARFTEAELDSVANRRGRLQIAPADDGTSDVIVRAVSVGIAGQEAADA